MKPRIIYGWENDGAAFLSPFSASYEKRPANRYATRGEAIAYVATRNSLGRENCRIEWEEPK